LAIVVPARNEERTLDTVLRFIERNLVEASRLLDGARVVVVDDSSTDKTPEIAKQYARKHGAIFEYVRLSHEKSYDSSIGVVRTVRAAVRYLEARGFEWTLLMQVDADTVLLPGYVKQVVAVMASRPEVGIAGGVTINEPQSRLHIRNTGMTLRREVWEQCGGYKPLPAPDTLMQLCAVSKGWKLALVRNAKMLVLRPTRLDPYKSGFVDGATGLSIPYAFLRAVRFSLRQESPANAVNAFAKYLSGILRAKMFENNLDLGSRRLFETHRLRELFSMR
jgi:cellulose synthase/poly-beta-1,6-N-acetylglucosamine synthase-like glycosyltransferase